MGIYCYRRTAEVFNAFNAEDGTFVKINVYRYYTKPYWDLWDHVMSTHSMPTYLDKWERGIVGKQRRAVGQQDALFYRMQQRGDISSFVIVLSEKGREGGDMEAEEPIYQEPQSGPRMMDDHWHSKAKQVGTLIKRGKNYYFIPKKEALCSVS